MDRAHKVLWKEGLFLTPQHFQSLDRRHEWLSSFYAKSVDQFFWGIRKIDIDVEAISNWQFSLKSAQLVMHDGTPVDCPDLDLLPPSRGFQKLLTPDKKSLLVYLGIPRDDTGRPGVKLDQGSDGEHVRYERLVRDVNDFVTGTKPREVEFVIKKPEIRFEGESSDVFDLLPIAKLELAGAGQPTLTAKFLPPCMTLSASPLWMELVTSLFARVNALSGELKQKLTYSSEHMLTVTNADIPNYFQARELLASLPPLVHFYTHTDSHPFHFYQLMSDLVARLGIIFGLISDNAADDFPAYNHESPIDGVTTLRDRLDTIFPLFGRSREGELPLTTVADRENMFSSSLAGQRLAGNEEVYLWAQADMPEEDMMRNFVSLVRVAASSQIDQLITFNLPGVRMERPTNVPTMLPAPMKGLYFRLDIRDKLWLDILDAGELMLHVREEDFPGLQVRLHILRS